FLWSIDRGLWRLVAHQERLDAHEKALMERLDAHEKALMERLDRHERTLRERFDMHEGQLHAQNMLLRERLPRRSDQPPYAPRAGCFQEQGQASGPCTAGTSRHCRGMFGMRVKSSHKP